MQGKLTVVVGGQFGSEAKGHVTAQLVRAYQTKEPCMVVRVGGPNAGHSAVGVLDGKLWSLRQIPVAAVVDLTCELVIGAGSEIDPDVLDQEIFELNEAGYAVSQRLTIDSSATIIDSHHKAQEHHGETENSGNEDSADSLVTRIGSTGKGIGAARAARAMRTAQQWKDYAKDHEHFEHTVLLMRRWLKKGGRVIIEGTQGFGLGSNAGFYPHCTSSNCRAIDFLSMAGLSPWAPEVGEFSVWVVMRTFPIRVAGNSGPLLGEHTWEEMADITGIEDLKTNPERTTVTKKVRRVGEFDWPLAQRAVIENGTNVNIALTFMDYIDPTLRDLDKLSPEGESQICRVQSMLGAPVRMITWGPDKSAAVTVDSFTSQVEVGMLTEIANK